MRLVFCGSPPFATPILQALLESRYAPVAVVTQPVRVSGRGRKARPSPIADLAAAAGVECLAPDSLKEPGFRERFSALEPELALVASYGELIDVELLAVPERGWINVHGSLLPRWRGASPVQAAILAGDRTTGVSIQQVVRRLDAGAVCHSIETEIGGSETGGELAARLAQLGARAALEAIEQIAAGTARFEPQDKTRITKCRKLTKADGVLDWTQPAELLERRVRAMAPWPGASTRLPDGETLKIGAVRLVPGGESAPGRIAVSEGLPRVCCGAGSLELLEVQPPGKRAMPAADWWRGARLEPGILLGEMQEDESCSG